MIKRFFAVSIAVKDLEAAAKKYGDVLGVNPEFTKPGDFPFPGIRGAFFEVGDVRIYLITSDQADTSVAKFVETRGEGVFLISLEVDDVKQTMKELTEKGVKFALEEPVTFKIATANFAHPKSMHGVQVEFIKPVPGMM